MRWLLLAGLLLASEASLSGPDGRAIYNFHCYFCHGYSGDGNTVAAAMLSSRPRDFTASDSNVLSVQRMRQALTEGISGSAMGPFSDRLSAEEIEAVIAFVRDEFMLKARENTRYHTAENGWPDHQRYVAAFPFVLGQIPLDADEQLSPEQRAGKRLYLSACVSCHDVGRAGGGAAPTWESEAVSYPRTGFQTGDFLEPLDAMSGATPYARHDQIPEVIGMTGTEKTGQSVFQGNCAFCHAADGTGKNWIGTFVQPHPRDLTRTPIPAQRLRQAIRDGLPGTSMPAWRDVLSADQIDALVAYIQRAFHGEGPLNDRQR